MIICKNHEQIRELMDQITAQGCIWNVPIYLQSGEVWEESGENQVTEHCPNCGLMTDRIFNCTDMLDGCHWTVNRCVSCTTVWYEKGLV